MIFYRLIKKINITFRKLRNEKKTIFRKKKSFKYSKRKSTKSLKNITINYCKIIQMLTKRYNFYNNIVNFSIWNNTSKHMLNNVIIVKKINTQRTLNMKIYNIIFHQKHRETKLRWISSSNYRNQKIQQRK